MIAEQQQTRQQHRAARAALAEARDRLRGLATHWREAVLSDLAARRTERDAHAAQIRQQTDRLDNLQIRAPLDGIVQGLQVHNLGQAVGANEALMNLVPETATLIVEARVDSSDIGFIRLGQPATVKVRTYDFIKFGALAGEVTRIAADATEDPQTRQVHYTVTIRTDKSHLGDHPGEHPVAPGMLVDVELKTGERSVLSYLTDRVLSTVDTAFKAR